MHTFNFKYKLKTPKNIRNNPDQAKQHRLEMDSIWETLERFDGYSLDSAKIVHCRDGRIITLTLKRNLNRS